jgi:hypothetical protein
LPAGSKVTHSALADSGAAVVTVSSGDASLRAIVRAPRGAFSPPEVVAASGARYIDAAVDDGGDAALVWEDFDSPAVLGSYRSVQGSWQPPIALSAAEPYAPGRRYAAVAIGSGGEAQAVWEDDSGAHIDLLTRAFGPSPLAPAVRVRRVPAFVREAPGSACTPRWARVVERARAGYVVESKSGFDKGTLYGCLTRRGKQVDISGYYDTWFRPSLAIAGPFAALAGFGCGPDDCYPTAVTVTDLRDEDSRFTRSAQAGVKRAAQVSALRLRADGAVAWIACASSFSTDGLDRSCRQPGRSTKWLFAWGRLERKPRLLVTARSIDPATLKLGRSLVTWTQGRRLRSARVP